MAGPEVAEDTPRREQPRGQATRQKLVAVAHDLFAREGYEGTSIGDVAKGAGVGVGTVYHHFADKRTLLIELLHAQAAKARIELVDDDGGPILRAFRSGDFRASFLESLREIRSLRLDNPQTMLVTIDMGRRDPEVASLCGQMERRFLDIVRRDLEAGVAMGRARGGE